MERIGSAHIVSYFAFWNDVELTLLLRIKFWNAVLEFLPRDPGSRYSQVNRADHQPERGGTSSFRGALYLLRATNPHAGGGGTRKEKLDTKLNTKIITKYLFIVGPGTVFPFEWPRTARGITRGTCSSIRGRMGRALSNSATLNKKIFFPTAKKYNKRKKRKRHPRQSPDPSPNDTVSNKKKSTNWEDRQPTTQKKKKKTQIRNRQ